LFVPGDIIIDYQKRKKKHSGITRVCNISYWNFQYLKTFNKTAHPIPIL